MSYTTFIDQQTVIQASWLNDVNISVYTTVPALSTSISGKLNAASNLSDLANAATARTNLGLGTASTFASTAFAASGTNTDITSLNSPALGSATATTQSGSDNSTKVATTAFAQGLITGISSKIQPLTATTSVNQLVVTLGSTNLDFRNGTLTSGTVTPQTISGTSITIATTSSLGCPTGILQRLAILIAYNAGSPVMCIGNVGGVGQLDETNTISPTTNSGSATSISTIYSSSAVGANSPYRIVGFVDATWISGSGWTITQVQGYGGQAFAALSSLGYGQTVQNLTGSRVLGTTYYNTTGRPIWVGVQTNPTSGTSNLTFLNGVQIFDMANGNAGGVNNSCSFIVPPNVSYSVAAGGPLDHWTELR